MHKRPNIFDTRFAERWSIMQTVYACGCLFKQTGCVTLTFDLWSCWWWAWSIFPHWSYIPSLNQIRQTVWKLLALFILCERGKPPKKQKTSTCVQNNIVQKYFCNIIISFTKFRFLQLFNLVNLGWSGIFEYDGLLDFRNRLLCNTTMSCIIYVYEDIHYLW